MNLTAELGIVLYGELSFWPESGVRAKLVDHPNTEKAYISCAQYASWQSVSSYIS